jgi:hypothetical protein
MKANEEFVTRVCGLAATVGGLSNFFCTRDSAVLWSRRRTLCGLGSDFDYMIGRPRDVNLLSRR